ncbi:MAG: hypothetical protein M5U25_13245 [Planctomycetota bacterium]|nr:hypothetical protein [Planctomycetota bacterium]
MIRLHASYGRKAPGETQFSSCQASASIDFEIADSEIGEVRARLSDAWAMLRDAVEAELARQQSGNHVTNRLNPDSYNPALPSRHNPGQTYQQNQQNHHAYPGNGNGHGSNGDGHHGNGVQAPYPGVHNNGAPSNGNGYHSGNGHNNNGIGAPPFSPNAQVAAPAAVSTPNPDARATKKQVGFLLATARRTRNWAADQVKSWVNQQFGCALNDLTKKQASELIDALQGRS